MSIKKAYDHWIFREYQVSNEGLALYRIFFAIMALFVIGYPDVTWMDQVSDFYYQPQPLNFIAFLFQEIPSYAVLFLLSMGPSVCLIAILIGYRTRIFALAFGLLVLVGMSLKASMGKMDHAVLFPLTAMIMAFSNWDLRYTIGPNKAKASKADGFPQWMVAFAIALAMVGAGYLKWESGWLEGDQTGVLHHFINSYFVWGRDALLAPWMFEIESAAFWQSLDVLTVGFELFFIIAVFRKKWFQKYLILALIFHTLIFLILNITIVNLFIAYALFLPWDRIHQEFKRLSPGLWTRIKGLKAYWGVLVGVIILSGTAYFIIRTETETPIAILNMLMFPLDWNYKWIQVILIYGLGYIFLFWIWRLRA